LLLLLLLREQELSRLYLDPGLRVFAIAFLLIFVLAIERVHHGWDYSSIVDPSHEL
jgi:hypothetical protein